MSLMHASLESNARKNACEFPMAGYQDFLDGNSNEPTCARIYVPSGGSDDLRKKISAIGQNQFGEGYKKIGSDYSYTPFWYGTNFSSEPTSMPGGGFFLTLKEKEDSKFLNCFAYALGTFENKLEELAQKDMVEIQKSVSQSIDHIVRQYFTNVSKPEDGDLAVYSVSPGALLRVGGIEVTGTTHAGIYRESKRNWNSPPGGTIESKWGWLSNHYVFQHDVFFTPDYYGDQVKFYRIKKPNLTNFTES